MRSRRGWAGLRQEEGGGPTRGYGGTGKVSAPRSAVGRRPLSAICDPDPSTFPSSRASLRSLLSSSAPSRRSAAGLRGNDLKLRGRPLIARPSFIGDFISRYGYRATNPLARADPQYPPWPDNVKIPSFCPLCHVHDDTIVATWAERQHLARKREINRLMNVAVSEYEKKICSKHVEPKRDRKKKDSKKKKHPSLSSIIGEIRSSARAGADCAAKRQTCGRLMNETG